MIPKRDKSFLVPDFICIVSLSLLFIVRTVLMSLPNTFIKCCLKKINEGKQNNCDQNSIDRITCVFPIPWLVVTGQVTPV